MMTVVNVGFAERAWPTEYGDVLTASWYPSVPAVAAKSYARVFPARAAHHATPVAGRHPLLLLVSGSGGNRYTYSYLAEDLARRGCWVMAPELPCEIRVGDSWAALWRQAIALRAVTDQARLSEAARLDGAGPIWVGHSIGGTLGVLWAGARPDCADGRWAAAADEVAHTMSGSLPPLRALVLLDAAVSRAFSRTALARVRVPAAVVTSGITDVDLFGRASRYAQHLGDVRLVHELAEAGHFVYCNPCPPMLASISPRACSGERVDRASFHPRLTELIGNFLSPWLSGASKGSRAA
ncbi:MAG TPA: hypothetical protein VGJ60_09740 [Chloroflexota bacterium]